MGVAGVGQRRHAADGRVGRDRAHLDRQAAGRRAGRRRRARPRRRPGLRHRATTAAPTRRSTPSPARTSTSGPASSAHDPRRPVRREPHHRGHRRQRGRGRRALAGRRRRCSRSPRPHPVQRLQDLAGPRRLRRHRLGQAVHRSAAGPGPYLRVLEEGEPAAGDEIEVVHQPGHGVTCRRCSAPCHGDRRCCRGCSSYRTCAGGAGEGRAVRRGRPEAFAYPPSCTV